MKLWKSKRPNAFQSDKMRCGIMCIREAKKRIRRYGFAFDEQTALKIQSADISAIHCN